MSPFEYWGPLVFLHAATGHVGGTALWSLRNAPPRSRPVALIPALTFLLLLGVSASYLPQLARYGMSVAGLLAASGGGLLLGLALFRFGLGPLMDRAVARIRRQRASVERP